MKSNDEGYFKVLFKWTASLMADRSCFDYLQQIQNKFVMDQQSKSLCFLSATFITKIMKVIQNYILNTIGNIIIEQSDGKYSIQIDTTTDRATVQQCSVVVRYVNKCLEVKERLLMFLPVQNSKGSTLFDFLKKNLTEIGLDINKMIASSTDGASSMTSSIRGLTGLLMQLNPAHIFTWCACHRFNLVLEDSFKENIHINELIKSLNSFSSFIRFSPNRMNDWKKIVGHLAENFKDINKRLRPAQTNATRWWSKFRAVNHVVNTESSLLAFLISLSNLNELKQKSKWSKKQKIQITNLQQQWLSKSGATNIGILYGVNAILERMHKTLDELQSSAQPYCNMLGTISSCHAYLQTILKDENGELTNLVKNSKCFIQKAISRLKIDSVQCLLNKRFNESQLIISPKQEQVIRKQLEEYLKSLIREVQDRFIEDFETNKVFYKELSLFNPQNIIQIDENSEISLDYLCAYNNMNKVVVISELKKFGPAFKSFLIDIKATEVCGDFENTSFDTQTKSNDVLNFDENLENGEDDENHTQCTIEWKFLKDFFAIEANREKFKNINDLYQYILTLPCSQVECERSFSTLDNIKTSHRTLLSDNILQTYMLIKSSWDLLSDQQIPKLIDLVGNLNSHIKKRLIDKSEA